MTTTPRRATDAKGRFNEDTFRRWIASMSPPEAVVVRRRFVRGRKGK